MTTRATEAAIKRALSAWRAVTNTQPSAVEITADGTIRVMAPVDTPATGAQPAKPKKWSAG